MTKRKTPPSYYEPLLPDDPTPLPELAESEQPPRKESNGGGRPCPTCGTLATSVCPTCGTHLEVSHG